MTLTAEMSGKNVFSLHHVVYFIFSGINLVVLSQMIILS